MSIMNTKPRYFPTAIAADNGWINPVTKELLVSVKNLKKLLAAEETTAVQEIVPVAAPVVEEPIINEVKEEIMQVELPQEPVEQPKQKRAYTKKVKVEESTNIQLSQGQQLIGEVVEYDIDTKVIGE